MGAGMADQVLIETLADELYLALKSRSTIPLISQRYPSLTLEDAYRISQNILEKRLADGETLIGKKIGLTAKAVQEILGINEPDFGFLTNAMQIENGSEVRVQGHMNTGMVEAEIALVMKADLPTQGVTPKTVLEATDYVCACLELVDTRFDTPKIHLVDTVADNASSSLFVLGEKKINPHAVNLPDIDCIVYRNGEQVLTGKGEAVMGSPLNSVAWLANKLGSLGVSITKGDIVLPGSVVPFASIAPGDTYMAEFSGLGQVHCSFK
jgi:2-oxopent-4-enoate/cis-2-oxohex-4-enoate hydratase